MNASTTPVPTPAELDFYTRPAAMTSAGRHAPLIDDLPIDDAAGLAGVLHGLVVHEHLTELYGFTLPDERRETVHIRPAEQLLDRIIADDGRPLDQRRAPERRLVGNCRHYTVLLVTMLRAKGVPARARCGFGDYFGTAYEDHWVAEYWHADQQRWVLIDAQLDEVLRPSLPRGFDPTDVDRDRFLVAGDAWARCRAGEADPSSFGFSFIGKTGAWWIAGNMLRDLAALNNTEMLPWDLWGVMPGVDEPVRDDLVPLLDRLAELTRTPSTNVRTLADAYDDERLHVPATVHNAIADRDEPVLALARPNH
ncbi:transglutaminase-like domain-containing protein [Phytoactinopolyspora halotolerans]|uniref:Transglutaminase domain-containing protein n=1 Tax=Phytoactinopolyspora halotolerans TaxID=1981512 RepID=A0A6L9S6G0_9ACTN|nr:transglutaminase domain-containing protein [Phytoactinopolyspora halotolerans]NEE00132.1 transglutaminase domain-containing protein [Phytoactinopolyspora halotolerans]